MTKFHFFILMAMFFAVLLRLDNGFQFWVDVFCFFLFVFLAMVWTLRNPFG